MKPLLVVLFSLAALRLSAQDYQCIQYGATQYYLNGVVRAIKIDSVVTSSGTSIFYPFRSPRGQYTVAGGFQQLDSTGGSWIGREIIIKQDGTTFIGTYWGDTVVIKPGGVGTSWNFYDDTSARYYQATVASVDTMTILGILDSVKTMTIAAYNNGGLNVSDLCHGKTIRISKNFGLVETFSLYMFPFHPSSSAIYQPGADYLMDMLDVVNGAVKSYHLFRLPDSTYLDLYNFSPGDEYEYLHTNYSSGMPSVNTWRYDSIISKTVVSASQINYKINSRSKTFYPAVNQTPASWVYNTSVNTLTANNNAILNFVPEQNGNPIRLKVNMDDTSYCFTAPLIAIDNGLYADGLAFEPCYKVEKYKKGLGRIYYSECLDPSGIAQDEQLIYYTKNTVSCGVFIPVTGVETITKKSISIFPNPANDYLYINSDADVQYAVIDQLGRTIIAGRSGKNEKIDVSTLADGAYILRLTASRDQYTAIKQFVVAH